MIEHRIGAFIQCRWGSERLPGKALLPLGSRSCLSQVLIRVLALTNPLDPPLYRVHVPILCTTDDPRDDAIAQEAYHHNMAVHRRAGANLLLRYIQLAETYQLDVVVRICADNPCLDPRLIAEAIDRLVDEDADYLITVGAPVGINAEVVTTNCLKAAYRKAVDPTNSADLTYLLRRPDHFHVVEHRVAQEWREPEAVLTLNTPTDYDVLVPLFTDLDIGEGWFPLEEAIAWWRRHPDIARLNMGYVPLPPGGDVRLRDD